MTRTSALLPILLPAIFLAFVFAGLAFWLGQEWYTVLLAYVIGGNLGLISAAAVTALRNS